MNITNDLSSYFRYIGREQFLAIKIKASVRNDQRHGQKQAKANGAELEREQSE